MSTLTESTPETPEAPDTSDTPSENDEIKNHPTANLMANKKATKDLTEAEKQILIELRKLYIESIEIEIEQHKTIFDIEVSIDEACKELFEERKKLLQEFTEPPLKHFWLRVFKNANISLSDYDEKILEHLIDVRSKMFTAPKVKMVIDFEFENNSYFSNSLLSKTYYIKCNADTKNAILYDGIEIVSTEGTKIDWKIKKIQNAVNNELEHSFFEFFNNHSETDIVNRALLSEEIAFGFFLREKVIPKAIYFFTGDVRTEMKAWDSVEFDNNLAYDEADDEADGDADADADAVDDDDDDIDYDGDSEADSDIEETNQYVEFVNELDTKEQRQRKNYENLTSDEERSLHEAENQPLIDTGDDS